MKKDYQATANILLVDDEPIVLNTLGAGLKSSGYTVTTCELPQKALEIYKQATPDLVITDYNMPLMDGLTMARSMIEITHRPIIMLSAYNDLQLVRDAIGVGISTYLVKPVEVERIIPSIESALARFAEISALIKQGDNIQAGVETHRIISTAVGIVMVQTNRPQDIAFESLRRMAREQRRPLRDLAFDLVDSTSTTNSILMNLPDMK